MEKDADLSTHHHHQLLQGIVHRQMLRIVEAILQTHQRLKVLGDVWIALHCRSNASSRHHNYTNYLQV